MTVLNLWNTNSSESHRIFLAKYSNVRKRYATIVSYHQYEQAHLVYREKKKHVTRSSVRASSV